MLKKKVLSVVLASAMVASVAAVSAISTSAADTRGTIYFDSTGLGGKAAATRGVYYCYIWNDADGALYAWDNKALKMTNVDGENLYSFDVPRLNSAGEEVIADLVIFHANGGEQTYDTTFNDACFGDTAYVLDDVLFENPVDSAKTAKGCAWRNNPSQGAHIAITSTGRVQGIGLVAGETAESITTKFQADYAAGMAEGKTGYDNADLLTEAAYNDFVAQINAIIAEQPTQAPTQAPTTENPTEAPTDAPVVEDPTEAPTSAVVEDPYNRLPGLPLPADMNVPAKDTNRDIYLESGEAPADWDGYFNPFYFEAPQEWIDQHKEAKDEGFDIGFYWYCGGLNNGEWPGVPAQKLSVLDENGNDIYADKNIYYGFAPSFATSIIWNNGISDAVAENIPFKLQTEDVKVDDPMSTAMGNYIYNEIDDTIDGAYVSGCLGYISNVRTEINGLTGMEQQVYEVSWKYFNPRTGETTVEPLRDADGNLVTVADDYWGYEKVVVNPYFDLNHDHINDAEVPTEKEPTTLPPAPTQTATDATKAPTQAPTTANNNAGKGTVDTAGNTAVVTLALVLLGAVSVTAVVRKREEA